MSQTKPVACVIVFPGTNGERDLWETFERAGFEAHYVDSRESIPDDTHVIGLPGGFAYGDYWRAGMLASQARAVASIPEHIARNALVIGICNGFQILVEAGLLPGALTYNEKPVFRHRWIHVRTQEANDSPWFFNTPAGTRMHIPMAHGEGNYFHPEGAAALTRRVPIIYEDNPNGSIADTAALLDDTGRVLGVMPHPERASDPDIGGDDGLLIFHNAQRYVQEAR